MIGFFFSFSFFFVVSGIVRSVLVMSSQFNGLGECRVVCHSGDENSLIRVWYVCMEKSLVCIGYVSHLLYVGLVYRVNYLVVKGFIGKVVYPVRFSFGAH